MEESGKVRRGYFVDGLAATQFAVPGADDVLRGQREPDPDDPVQCLAATDPANPYGAAIPWPNGFSGRPERAPGARVILKHGELIGFLSRSGKNLLTRLSEDLVQRRQALQSIVSALIALTEKRGLITCVVEQINGAPAAEEPEADAFVSAGFRRTSSGLFYRRQAGEGGVDARR